MTQRAQKVIEDINASQRLYSIKYPYKNIQQRGLKKENKKVLIPEKVNNSKLQLRQQFQFLNSENLSINGSRLNMDFNHFDINDTLQLKDQIHYDNRLDGDLFGESSSPE